MPNCAECTFKSCFKGTTENVPKNCPGLSNTPAEMLALYSEEDRRAGYASACVEAEGYTKITRVEETMDYAYKMGYRHLGVAFCIGLKNEGATLCRILRANGFKVDSVCCKNGCVSKSAVGIKREQQLHPENDFEAMCNPVGQAKMLDDAGCEFAIILGLCVGHDTLFLKYIKAPCTVLSSKDRAMGNNPMGAIYTADSYMRRQNSFLANKYGENPWKD